MSNGRLFVILGMHRGGTSAFSRALISLNVSLGSNIMPPHPIVNAKGFWEDQSIYELSEEVLAALNSGWDHFSPITTNHLVMLRQLGLIDKAKALLRSRIGEAANGLFAFKDPRTARLILFWKEVFAGESYEVLYLLPYRNALSVAKSLEKRDRFELTKSYLLWLSHMVPSLMETSEMPRLLINYDDLLDAPEALLSNIAIKFNLSISETGLKEYVNEFLAPELRHTQYSLEDLEQDLSCPALVIQVQRLLNEISMGIRNLDSAETHHLIQQFNDEMLRFAPLFDLLDKKYRQYFDIASTVANKDAAINQMTGVIEKQSQQYDSLAAKLVAFEQQVQSLQNDFVIVEEQRRNIKNELSNAEAKNDALNNNLAQKTYSLQIAQTKLNDTLHTVEMLSLRCEKAEQQQALSIKQLELANATIVIHNQVIAQIVQANQELQRECATLARMLRSKSWPKRLVAYLNRLLFGRMTVATTDLDLSKLPTDFDPAVYLELNPDVVRAGFDPYRHYVLHGKNEARRYKYAID